MSEQKLMLGAFEVPQFTKLNVAFGATEQDYPPMAMIPKEYHSFSHPKNKIAGTLFFEGGKLEDHGVKLINGIDPGVFYTALKSYLASYAPQHEHKMATCAWLIDSYTEPTK